jgi:predicted nucleic acid-binding protein
MKWVVDCSFSAALFLPDESSKYVKEFFIKLKKDDELYVPSLWWYEITNVLLVSEKRGRLNHVDAIKVLSLFEKIELETDKTNGIYYSREIFKIAQYNNLSVYDAVYLELAIRKVAGLASLDNQLIKAAINYSISII